ERTARIQPFMLEIYVRRAHPRPDAARRQQGGIAFAQRRDRHGRRESGPIAINAPSALDRGKLSDGLVGIVGPRDAAAHGAASARADGDFVAASRTNYPHR